MILIINSVLPLIALVGAGWLARKLKIVSPEQSQALNSFVCYFALPALLFYSLAKEPVHGLFNVSFLLAVAGGTFGAGLAASVVGRIAFGRNITESTMMAWCASFTNTGYMALPILGFLYGPSAMRPLAVCIFFYMVVVAPGGILLLEFTAAVREQRRVNLAPLLSNVLINPLVYPTIGRYRQ